MCLVVDEEKTQKMKKETGGITVWKVYEVVKGQLRSPLFPGSVSIKEKVVSDRNTQKPGHDWFDEWNYEKKIYRGIHVCLNREAARKYKRCLKRDHKNERKKFVIVRCQAEMGHFVATGYSYYRCGKCHKGAVFMEIFISPENLEKALNGKFR